MRPAIIAAVGSPEFDSNQLKPDGAASPGQHGAGRARRSEPGGQAARDRRNYLIYLNAGAGRSAQKINMWHFISTAPLDRDIELAVIDKDGQHALVFPCRRIPGGWMNALTKERLDVRPTHWRAWNSSGTTDGANSGDGEG